MPEFSKEVNTIIETEADDFINSLESVDKISNLYFHQQLPLGSGLLWVCKELQVSINLRNLQKLTY